MRKLHQHHMPPASRMCRLARAVLYEGACGDAALVTLLLLSPSCFVVFVFPVLVVIVVFVFFTSNYIYIHIIQYIHNYIYIYVYRADFAFLAGIAFPWDILLV